MADALVANQPDGPIHDILIARATADRLNRRAVGDGMATHQHASTAAMGTAALDPMIAV